MLGNVDEKDTLQDTNLERNATNYSATNTRPMMTLETETATDANAVHETLIETISDSPLHVAKPTLPSATKVLYLLSHWKME